MARRADRLAALAEETGCTPLSVDVTDGAALATALDGVAPDILVNNAGLGVGISGLMGAAREDLARTIGTNVTALLDLCRLVLPGMVARGQGHVVNTGSVAGLHISASAIYGASKGAVHLLSQNLRLELRGTGVRVTEICPGRVATEFYDAALGDPVAVATAKDTGILELQPSDIASAIHYAVMAPPHVNVSTIELFPTEQTYGGVTFSPVKGAFRGS